MAMDTTYELPDGTTVAATVRGTGPGLLLAHGWPHGRAVWSAVLDELAAEFTVLVPDLPGLGGSGAPRAYDPVTVAGHLGDLATAAGLDTFSVMAVDASVAPVTMLALVAPHRVQRAVLMEGLLPGRPGAEAFLAAGAPWWFGFHTVPGLAETVLAGHLAEYVGFFLDQGTTRPIDDDVHAALIAAHAGDRFARGLEYYRALPLGARQFADTTQRLTVPTLAIGSAPVGDALAGQLRLLGDTVSAQLLDDCGHIVPLDAPDRLLALALPFLRATG